MNPHSIWAIAHWQDLASGTHPKPSALRINDSEKLVFETLTRSVDEGLDRLALASVSDTWTKEGENYDGRIYTPLQVLGCFDCEGEGEEIHGKITRSGCGQLVPNAAERTMVNDEEDRRGSTMDDCRRCTGTRRIC